MSNDLAYSRNIGSVGTFQLWAGNGEIKTTVLESGSAVFEKYEVVALAADGKTIVKYDPEAVAADAPEKVPFGFVCQPTTAEDASVAVFYAGTPNHDALVWPVTVATYADRKAAFLNGHAKNEITIEKLLPN